jgi:hypothetical protein
MKGEKMDIKTFKEEIKKINAGDGVHIKILSKDYQPAIENNKLRPEWWANQNWAEFSYENKKLFLSSVGEVDVLITDKASGDMLEHHKAPINDSSIITEDDDIMLILDGDTDYALAFDETPMLALVNAKGKPVHYFNYNNNVVTALLDHLDEIKDIMSPKEEVSKKSEPKSEEKPKAKDEPKEKKEEEPKAEKTKRAAKEGKSDSPIKDSGERQEFSTGAVRDIQTGKGRCDLLPLDIVAEFMTSKTDKDILELFAEFQDSGDYKCLVNAAAKFADEYFADRETAVLEYAIQLENGAIKYGPRNWQKGIPLDRYVDSGIRHYMKHLRGDSDERHDRAALWNMLCGAWTRKNKIGE